MNNSSIPNEIVIRDFLANNLDIIEPDLQLISKEFPIENSFGAGGRIDILAKDKFGIFVIIEIKRSNQAARQALHELQKYIALFKTNNGFSPEKCRCILLSTEWHELLIPFSEFSRIVGYQIDGYQLILNKQGMPITKKAIPSLPEAEERLIFPIHNIYLYETNENREVAIEEIQNILREIKIKNYYILIIDYQGESEKVIYPFAIYLVIDYLNRVDELIIGNYLNILDTDDHDDEDELYIKPAIETEVLSEITSRLLELIDTMESGSPEKLQSMIFNGWAVNKIYRGNQLSVNLLITDNEILKEITSFEAGNSVLYTSVATPRIQALWKATSEKVQNFLCSNDLWKIGSQWFLQKIESTNREATVSLRIYYAFGILFSLYNYFCRDIDYFSNLEIVAQIPGETNKTIILLGFLEWDRHTFPEINSIFKNQEPFEVFYREQLFFKVQPYYDLIMMYKHGIEYSLFEITLERNIQPVIKRLALEEDESITLVATTDEIGASLREFFIQNSDYLQELCYKGSLCFDFAS